MSNHQIVRARCPRTVHVAQPQEIAALARVATGDRHADGRRGRREGSPPGGGSENLHCALCHTTLKVYGNREQLRSPSTTCTDTRSTPVRCRRRGGGARVCSATRITRPWVQTKGGQRDAPARTKSWRDSRCSDFSTLMRAPGVRMSAARRARSSRSRASSSAAAAVVAAAVARRHTHGRPWPLHGARARSGHGHRSDGRQWPGGGRQPSRR